MLLVNHGWISGSHHPAPFRRLGRVWWLPTGHGYQILQEPAPEIIESAVTAAIPNVLHIQFPPQGEASRGRRLCGHLHFHLRIFGRRQCLVHGGRALGHEHGSGGHIEPGIGFGGLVCHLPPFHLCWLHRFVPRLRRGNSCQFLVDGSCVCGFQLSAYEAKKGEAWKVQKENPEAPTLLGIFRDLPTVKLLISCGSYFAVACMVQS